MDITINGTNEMLITTGRDRACPLCGNLFTMGSLHGVIDFDIDELLPIHEPALDEFGNLACPTCLTAAAAGVLPSRIQEYAEYLRNLANLLDLLAKDSIEPEFDPEEIRYTGTVVGGPMLY